MNEYGVEFWYARELQAALEYKEWRNFYKVMNRAVIACENSENEVADHFVEVNKTICMPKGATKEITPDKSILQIKKEYAKLEDSEMEI